MKRPVGVTILALLLLLEGAALAVHAAVLMSHPDIGAGFTNAYMRHLFPSDRGDAGGMLIASLSGAAILLVLGGGMWFLQNWARWGLILMFGRRLVAVAEALWMSPSGVRKHLGDAFWLQTIVCGVIVLYLVQPDVQLAFGASKEYYDEYAPVESDSGECKPELKNPVARP